MRDRRPPAVRLGGHVIHALLLYSNQRILASPASPNSRYTHSRFVILDIILTDKVSWHWQEETTRAELIT
ncbi:MAG: hypothetical protein RR296_08385, partial [Clostridia bacterium]